MAPLFSDKKLLTYVVSGVFLVLTIVTGTVAALGGGGYRADANMTGSSEPTSVIESDPDALPVDADVEQPPEEELPPQFNKPDEMRAAVIKAGKDYMLTAGATDDSIKAEIDAALSKAKELTVNTIFIDTRAEDKVIYRSTAMPPVSANFDVMEYIVTKCRDNELYTYAIYNASDVGENGAVVQAVSADSGVLDTIAANTSEFAQKYNLDGILIDGYQNPQTGSSYAEYLKNGGGVGFENYMAQLSKQLFHTVSQTIRDDARHIQVGLLADAVWDNKSEDNEEGSETTSDYTSLRTAHADTKRFLEEGMADFVAVRNFGSLTDEKAPFDKVVQWWSNTAGDNDAALYIMQASDQVCTDAAGWQAPDQLTKQVLAIKDTGGINGSIFNSLKALIDDPKESTTTLIKFYGNKINPEHILKELGLTKPAKMKFTSIEPNVTFSGASDPNFDVTINGQKIETNENGYFTVTLDLKEGDNQFIVSHKEKTLTYTVTRQIQIIKEVTPVGKLAVDGGMNVTISALAFEDATVYATVNNQTIPMEITETQDDKVDKDSNYKLFKGTFRAPASGASAKSLGNIVVTAEWEGATDSKQGAAVTLNKKAELGDGNPIVVTATQAETFPVDNLNDYSDPTCYPLPQGTMDIAYGDEIIYKDGNNTFAYYKLQSGKRVYSKDITGSNSMPDNNTVKSAKFDGDKLYITMEQKVSYAVAYDGTYLTIDFHYTNTTPSEEASGDSVLFSSGKWSGSELKLKFSNAGAFLGYEASYDGDVLVFDFNISPGSLKGARVVVDPGHGGSDPGAIGFYPGLNESDINRKIAAKLASQLESRGAKVLLLDTSGTMKLVERMERAVAFSPHVLVSVHCNSATSSASGSEAYYFYSFSKSLATNASAKMASALSTSNRGSKFAYFYMTRQSRFGTMLAECGFVSNKSQYSKLIDSSYQTEIAVALANSVSVYLGGKSSGNTAGDDDDDDDNEDGSASVSSVELDKDTLSLSVGGTFKLSATVSPSNAADKSVTWASNKSSVAKVSTSGTITAVAPGTATITVTTKDGSRKATCRVTVTKASETPVTKVSIDNAPSSMAIGSSVTLTATVSPDDANNQEVEWSTSTPTLVTIDRSRGKVTAKAAGSAKITVTSLDSGKSATCTITINSSGVAVTGVTVSSKTETMKPGDEKTLSATVSPSNATNKTVTWSSSDTKVASVDSRGRITAVAAGTAKITATTQDGGKTAVCTVTVEKGGKPVTGVELDMTEITMEIDEGYTLIEYITPENATNQNVRWSSSNSAVVSVNSSGFILALKEGKATITVTTVDGGHTAKCVVTVKKKSDASSDASSSEGSSSDSNSSTPESKPESTPESTPNASSDTGSTAQR